MNVMMKKISEYLVTHKEIKVISFDIFDTVLFRMVRKPEDVFEIVGKKAIEKNILPDYITPIIYKNIRIEAERKARMLKMEHENIDEVTLEEIVACLPQYCCKQKERLRSLEIQTEEELCYINPDMFDVFEYLKCSGKYKIIFISDMYLNAEKLKKIMKANGLSISENEKIYVSCDILKNKKSEELYKYVLNEQKINASEMLHIGDNYLSDIISAKEQNISTIFYDVISGEKYMALQMEQLRYGVLFPQVYSLRKYVASCIGNCEYEKEKWFQIGAMVMGPLMTGFAEWILDTAEKENIKRIFPLMREGKIISKLLLKAAEYRSFEFQIEPMYISRKAVFFPALKEWNEASFYKIFENTKGTVGAILDMFEIQDKKLELYRNEKLRDVHKIQIGHQSIKDYLKTVLLKKDVVETINKKIKNETEYMNKYLKQIDANERFITADLGMKGTMQKALTEILDDTKDEKKMVHLLMFGAYDILQKIVGNIDIRGYAANAGDNEDIAFCVVQRPHIWEQLLMCDDGTTIGYSQNGKPITKQISDIHDNHYQKISWCQDGMLSFQNEYLKLKKKGKKIDCESLSDAVNIAVRMIQLPTYDESVLLGNLQFDENYGVDSVEELCKKNTLEEIKKIGIDNFIQSSVPGQIPWIEGAITQVDASYYIDKVLVSSRSSYEQSIIRIVKQVINKKQKKVIVAGAGEAGRKMQKYLELYGITVEAFTDSNSKLQGNMINGIVIKRLDDDFESNCYVIASFAFAEEIKEQIIKLKGEQAIVCHC